MPKQSMQQMRNAEIKRVKPVVPIDSVSGPTLLDLARQMQAMRAKLSKLFPKDVFRDSAWDVMLELFVAEEENRPVCVKELILASRETSTSALRRIDRLEATDLLRRSIDPVDHRRVAVALTMKGEEVMAAMLHNLFLTGTPRAEGDGQPGLGPFPATPRTDRA